MGRAAVTVVVSGTGLVTGFGDGVEAYRRGLLDGAWVPASAPRFAPAATRSPACHVAGDAAAGRPLRRDLLRRACTEALASAGLAAAPPDTVLVVAGVVGHIEPTGDRWAEQLQEISVGPGWPAGEDPVGARETVLLAHACASGAYGLAWGREALLAGAADAVLVAGASVVNAYDHGALETVRALSPERARPFDRDRSGTTVGEGAGAVLLETAEGARARGHRPAARLDGAACRTDPGDATSYGPRAAAGCVRAALADAGRAAVDHVHAHGTGSRRGDADELAALEDVAAERGWAGVPVSSHKGAVGHLLHASAFPAVVAAVVALRGGVVPGTAGLRTPPETDRLRLPREAEPGDVRAVLVTSFGFGGNNAALVLAAP